MNIRKIWFPVIIAFLLGIALTLFFLKKYVINPYLNNPEMQKLNEIIGYIDNYYLDTVQKDLLYQDAINGMLQALDPHSVYINAEENKQLSESLNGAFEGVGIQFNIMNDTVMVVATVHGGPSEKVGIRAGDRIVSVDGKSVAGNGIKNEEVFKILRGKKNTTVKIGIKRPSFSQIYFYNVIRDVIPTYTVDVSYMIDNQIGYIKINQFGENTYNEFMSAIYSLRKQGLQSLILDLRGNPGGYLNTAIDICDELLPNKEMIVYTEGLKVPSNQIFATKRGSFEKGKLVVLIDDFSASASEIVAGAVQDNDRGWVVGRRSFGKGLVQQQFDLSDKSSLRLTIARYHTPSGRCIQKKYDKGDEVYYEDLLHRYENGEMDNADSIKFDKSLQYKTKKGRIVYGGGGIMPDFFVPLDRDSNTLAFNEIFNSGLLIEFTFNYTNQNHEQLTKQFKNSRDFVKKMVVSDALVAQFMKFYTQKGNPSVKLNHASNKELKLWIKAFIGRNLYEDKAFYPIINSTDKTILKALEVINNKSVQH